MIFLVIPLLVLLFSVEKEKQRNGVLTSVHSSLLLPGGAGGLTKRERRGGGGGCHNSGPDLRPPSGLEFSELWGWRRALFLRRASWRAGWARGGGGGGLMGRLAWNCRNESNDTEGTTKSEGTFRRYIANFCTVEDFKEPGHAPPVVVLRSERGIASGARSTTTTANDNGNNTTQRSPPCCPPICLLQVPRATFATAANAGKRLTSYLLPP